MARQTSDVGRWSNTHLCVACRWPVPIRSAVKGEASGEWTCGWCGHEFNGIFGIQSPEDHRGFARQVEDNQLRQSV